MIAAQAAGIHVFATGGIGGVHRGALVSAAGGPATFDISSDLEELARTPMAVVCAGPKAILDVPATLEYLETRGVPVVAVGQEELPGFYARSLGVTRRRSRSPTSAAAARLVARPARARARRRDPPLRAGPGGARPCRGGRAAPRSSGPSRTQAPPGSLDRR